MRTLADRQIHFRRCSTVERHLCSFSSFSFFLLPFQGRIRFLASLRSSQHFISLSNEFFLEFIEFFKSIQKHLNIKYWFVKMLYMGLYLNIFLLGLESICKTIKLMSHFLPKINLKLRKIGRVPLHLNAKILPSTSEASSIIIIIFS